MTISSRRIGSGVAFLAALFVILAIACGPSAATETVANTSDVSPTAPPDAAAASRSGTESAGAAPATDASASQSGADGGGQASGTASEAPTATSAPPTLAPARVLASANQIPNIAGIHSWLNTEDALQISQLTADGKVVLVDFWTYTCVNCIRTLPFLREWWSRYEDDGLVILGIHTPEFEFEKDRQNVADAIETHSIGWPVAQDNDMITWRNFENRYWPAKYLYNSRGELIYSHFGEGAYGETEQRIRSALVEAGADLSDDPLMLLEDQVRDKSFQSSFLGGRAAVTPELYAGWHRNFLTARAGRPPYVAQQEYFESIDLSSGEHATGIIDVTVPQDIKQHAMYFQGQWSVEPERIRHARVTENLEDYLALNYAAKSINAVLTSDSGEPYRVFVTVDGAMLTPDNAGQDIQWDENGYSYVEVNEPRMYGLVDNPQYLRESILTMRSNSDDFGLFAFTFGVYAEGP